MRSQAVLGLLVVVITLTDATGQHMDDLINNENKGMFEIFISII